MLTDLTIAEARDALRAKEFSAVDLTMAHLHAIEALNPRLNAFITVSHAQAVDQARAADAALAAGDERALTGIPLAIKDLFCTTGTRTTAGSKILGPFVPPYESTVTRTSAARWGGVPGQGEYGRVRHGVVEHDLGVWAGGKSLEAQAGCGRRAGAGRIVGRVCLGGRGQAGDGGDRDGHRRLDPATGVVLRIGGGEADLWAVFAMGGGGVRFLARSPWASGADRAGWRRSCWGRWPVTIRRIPPVRLCRCRISRPPVGAA